MLNKLLFNKDEEFEIEVFTPHEFLLDIEETVPKPARHYIPSWWKDVPRFVDNDHTAKGTVKVCPSFVQMFNQGIVIPMWCDTILSHDDKQFYWKTSNSMFTWEFHPDWQFLDYVKVPTYKQVFKAVSPWFIKTPPGVSLFQFPLPFEYNPDFTVVPGILNTDFHYQLNQQIIYTSPENQFTISRGTPLVWYVPYRRTEFDYQVKKASDELEREVWGQMKSVGTKFSGHYIKEMKQRGIK